VKEQEKAKRSTTKETPKPVEVSLVFEPKTVAAAMVTPSAPVTIPVSTPTPIPNTTTLLPAVTTDLRLAHRGSKELKGDIACSAVDVMCPWSGPERMLQTHVAGCHYASLKPVLSSLLKQNQEILAELKELRQLYTELKK